MPRYAAIDIGSNSIRMQAAEVLPGVPIKVLAADREVTRLGGSVFRTGQISPDAMNFVCQVLSRMADTYKRLDVVGVRAVATSAVRDASNQAEFIARASGAIGSPIDIISGSEEARLIHLGVQSRWPQNDKQALIIDVGGGSAEIIYSANGLMREGISRPLGAVRLTEVFLKNDPPTPVELRRLEEFIDEKLQPVLKKIAARKFDRAIATSATAAALVCAVNRIPRIRRDEANQLRATTSQVRKLYKEISALPASNRKKVPGIGPRRAEIIVAGTAVFLRVLESFGLLSLSYSTAGVRDGIIADLSVRGVGRELSRLSRDQLRATEAMSSKYGVSLKHGRRVAQLGHALFEGLQPLHKLAPSEGRILEAASFLHDTGHYVSDTGHHKHSSYLVQNSDLPGFTDPERVLISQLCRYHRKAMPTPKHEAFQSLLPDAKRTLIALIPLLRLADALDTGQEDRVKAIQCEIRPGTVHVQVDADKDADLEIWAAERVSDAFRQIYGLALTIARSKR